MSNTYKNTFLAILLFASFLSACGSSGSSSGAALVVVVDASESAYSGWEPGVPASAAAGAVFEFLNETQVPPSLSIEVIAVGTDLAVETLYYEVAPKEWTPTPDDPAPRRSWSRRQIAAVANLKVQDRPDSSSAIFAALWQGARHIEESGARFKRLVLVSDLRDVSAGLWDFTLEIPEATNILGALAAQGAVPDLHGIDLHACGVHTSAAKITVPPPPAYYASPQLRPWSTAQHQRLQAVWEAVAVAGDAASFHMTGRCPAVPADLASGSSASTHNPTAR